MDALFVTAIATIAFVLGFTASAIAFRTLPPAVIDIDELGIGAPTEPPGVVS